MSNTAIFQSLEDKLKILTEGAKYDVSCSSSGSERGSVKGSLGSCNVAGVCHSFTADGRCISLMKLLVSNHCEFDCLYCANRRSNDIPRARLTPQEIAAVVIGLYKRNYIEGLFLSSAVDVSPNQTMQTIIDTLLILRNEHKFRGYIHIKTIPGAAESLIEQAATLADRMSVNIELPSEDSLKLLAPQKKKEMLIAPMKKLSNIYVKEQLNDEKRRSNVLPAGQTTQMIIGATPDSDGQIIRLSEALYRKFLLKRVYYSAYIPVNRTGLLPATAPDLRRENRLYQADWLLRFYNFDASELIPVGVNFSLDVDPKCDWALRNIDKFPVEVNTASHETLLRVPGIGVRNAYRIVKARRHSVLTFDSLKKMRIVMPKAIYFITANGEYRGIGDKPDLIRLKLTAPDKFLLPQRVQNIQTSLFDSDLSLVTGEL